MDFFASEPHFIDHLLPIYNGMSGGRFFITQKVARYAAELGIHVSPGVPGPVVAVASYGDLRKMAPRKAVFVEHGVGLSYGNAHPSYSGGRNRDNIVLYLATNQGVADRQLAMYPDQNVQVVGAPKLDRWHNGKSVARDDRMVAVSFHWDCKVVPETRSAFPYFRAALPELSTRFNLLGHGHPRDWLRLGSYWASIGVRRVPLFEDVMRFADVFVCDNSSTLYEFASTGRPVVVMNSPLYRKNVNHGLRFWDDIPGIQVDSPDDLGDAVEEALADSPEWAQRRMEITDKLYPHRGHATRRAVEAIERLGLS